MRFIAADRRLPPALGFSLLAHVAVFIAFRPPVPDMLARHVSQIIDVQFAAIAPLASVARPQAARKPPPVTRATQSERPAPLTNAAPESAHPPGPAEDLAEAPATAPSPEPPAASETASTTPAAPIAEAQYDVQGLDNPKPPYPLAARRQGFEGRVLLAAHVRTDGSCGDVRLKQSSGHTLLDRAALDTVKRWRFLPASRAGNSIDSWVDVPIRFRLEDRV